MAWQRVTPSETDEDGDEGRPAGRPDSRRRPQPPLPPGAGRAAVPQQRAGAERHRARIARTVHRASSDGARTRQPPGANPRGADAARGTTSRRRARTAGWPCPARWPHAAARSASRPPGSVRPAGLRRSGDVRTERPPAQSDAARAVPTRHVSARAVHTRAVSTRPVSAAPRVGSAVAAVQWSAVPARTGAAAPRWAAPGQSVRRRTAEWSAVSTAAGPTDPAGRIAVDAASTASAIGSARTVSGDRSRVHTTARHRARRTGRRSASGGSTRPAADAGAATVCADRPDAARWRGRHPRRAGRSGRRRPRRPPRPRKPRKPPRPRKPRRPRQLPLLCPRRRSNRRHDRNAGARCHRPSRPRVPVPTDGRPSTAPVDASSPSTASYPGRRPTYVPAPPRPSRTPTRRPTWRPRRRLAPRDVPRSRHVPRSRRRHLPGRGVVGSGRPHHRTSGHRPAGQRWHVPALTRRLDRRRCRRVGHRLVHTEAASRAVDAGRDGGRSGLATRPSGIASAGSRRRQAAPSRAAPIGGRGPRLPRRRSGIVADRSSPAADTALDDTVVATPEESADDDTADAVGGGVRTDSATEAATTPSANPTKRSPPRRCRRS